MMMMMVVAVVCVCVKSPRDAGVSAGIGIAQQPAAVTNLYTSPE